MIFKFKKFTICLLSFFFCALLFCHYHEKMIGMPNRVNLLSLGQLLRCASIYFNCSCTSKCRNKKPTHNADMTDHTPWPRYILGRLQIGMPEQKLECILFMREKGDHYHNSYKNYDWTVFLCGWFVTTTTDTNQTYTRQGQHLL